MPASPLNENQSYPEPAWKCHTSSGGGKCQMILILISEPGRNVSGSGCQGVDLRSVVRRRLGSRVWRLQTTGYRLRSVDRAPTREVCVSLATCLEGLGRCAP